VTPTRCTIPLPGRAVSDAKNRWRAVVNAVTPTIGLDKSARSGSERTRRLSAIVDAAPSICAATDVRSCQSFTVDCR